MQFTRFLFRHLVKYFSLLLATCLPLTTTAKPGYYITALPNKQVIQQKTHVHKNNKLGKAVYQVVTETSGGNEVQTYQYMLVDESEHMYHLYIPGLLSPLSVTGLTGYFENLNLGSTTFDDISSNSNFLWLEDGPSLAMPDGFYNVPVFIITSIDFLEFTTVLTGYHFSGHHAFGRPTHTFQIILDEHFQLVQLISGGSSVTYTADSTSYDASNPETAPVPVPAPPKTQANHPFDVKFGDFCSADNLYEPISDIEFCDQLSLSRLLGDTGDKTISDDEISELSEYDPSEFDSPGSSCNPGLIRRHYRRDHDDDGSPGSNSAGASQPGRYSGYTVSSSGQQQSGNGNDHQRQNSTSHRSAHRSAHRLTHSSAGDCLSWRMATAASRIRLTQWHATVIP